MQSLLKVTLVAVTAGLIGVAVAPSTMAQSARAVPHAMSYDSYQYPQGQYNSAADFVRSINGTPCGETCTREAQSRSSQSVRDRAAGW
jgi:hypothetical protein